MSTIMVINMGLKSIRCILFNHLGIKMGTSAVAINTAINDKRVEQNPAEWWEKAESVMKNACKDANVKRVDYVTVTTSASCLVCMDGNGNALTNAYMVSDKRAEQETREIKQLPMFQEVKRKTGLDVSVSLMLPKILWVKRHLPDVFDKTHYFVTPNDYLIYHLCGRVVTDYFNAIKYHYFLEEKKYPLELLDKLQIDEKKLPDVIFPGEIAGKISKTLAQKIEINEDAQVVVSSYDAICSFVGSGVSEEGEASDVSGTVTVLRAFSRKTNLKNSNKVYSVPFYQENAKIVGGSNNMGGGLIEWVKQCYYQYDQWPYEIMEKDAKESEIGARGLIFLPYLLGERAPLWDDNARGVFFGLERMHTRKDMTRAVFESTGFIDRDMIRAISETGVEIQSVRLSGGLARLNLISQIKADILGKDVMVLSEFETTASGAAMMVLLGQKEYDSLKQISEHFAKVRMIIRPDAENHRKYEYMYELYRDTYGSLKEMFARRTATLEKIRSEREVRIENL